VKPASWECSSSLGSRRSIAGDSLETVSPEPTLCLPSHIRFPSTTATCKARRSQSRFGVRHLGHNRAMEGTGRARLTILIDDAMTGDSGGGVLMVSLMLLMLQDWLWDGARLNFMPRPTCGSIPSSRVTDTATVRTVRFRVPNMQIWYFLIFQIKTQ